MTTKLIIYQLENSKLDYSSIRDKIKSFGAWTKIMDRTWIVKSDLTAGQIRTILGEAIENRGKIFVLDMNTNSWGSYKVDKNATKWIKDNLKD